MNINLLLKQFQDSIVFEALGPTMQHYCAHARAGVQSHQHAQGGPLRRDTPATEVLGFGGTWSNRFTYKNGIIRVRNNESQIVRRKHGYPNVFECLLCLHGTPVTR